MAARKILQKRRLIEYIVIVLNLFLIVGLVSVFYYYERDQQQRSYEQNIDDISNVNQASANIASSFLSGREAKLCDLVLYIENSAMSLDQAMAYICDSNTDTSKQYELIGPDHTGYCVERDADGQFIPIEYGASYKELCEILDRNIEQTDNRIVGFTPEFTDARTAMKSFALYNCLRLRDESGGITVYTLMSVSKSADLVNLINLNSGYEELETAITNTEGAYILGNSAFKSDNFFDFLAVFNDLTLDQKNEIAAQVTRSERGSLAYLNARDRKCVFVYTPVPERDWFCITMVPVERFRNIRTEFAFTIYVVLIMLLLLVINMTYLAFLNRRLKLSAENERVASMAKTDFLSRMSHDMRTPMNGIIGMTRLTQDIPDLPEEVQSNLAAIADSSGYLLQLINDTLDMNKIESKKVELNPTPVHVQELAQHVLATIKPLVDQKQIKLEYVPVDLENSWVLADRMRLQQIFMNILSNAVKFSPEHGRIRIEAECLKHENGIYYDRISIQDDGCGMSQEFLKHIFEPFSQERTRIVRGQEGTGLGMSIVKNLVELMGGSIDIKSQLGVGTCITLLLQFEQAQNMQEQQIGTAQNEVCLDGKRVLLVEDHPLNATIAMRLLGKKKMLVEHAENGVEAVRMFHDSARGYYDVILMDIRMPKMDGLEASRQIRAMVRPDAKTIPILAMTANAYAEDVQSTLEAGMNSHISKPVEPEVLYQQLRKYL